MTPLMIALLGVGALLVLMLFHVPMAFAMMIVGVAAFALQTSWAPALTYLASEPIVILSNMDFASVPLFLMMGAFVTASGFSKDLYIAAAAALGHRPGGLAYSTILGSAAFGSVCGSSAATAVTFARVAHPEMVARGYEPNFSAASIAAGGALKALIPPSLSMILYCVVAKVFIFDLFIAAIIPALLTISLNLAAIAIVVRMHPALSPVTKLMPWRERLILIARAGPAILLIAVVFLGLYSGIFTVNEAAAVAAVVAFIFALARRTLSIQSFKQCLLDTAKSAGMLYFLLMGAAIFSYFVNLAKLPEQLVAAISAVDAHPLMIIGLLLLFYLILGAVFDEIAAMIVTLPIVLPIIVKLGFDPIWWGIINVVIIELGLIVPPVGIIVLLLSKMANLSPAGLYRAVTPFIIANLIALALLTLFPVLSLWLPTLLRG